jgi:hypothetical protein
MRFIPVLLMFVATPGFAQVSASYPTSPVTNGEARVAALELSRAIQYATPTTGQTVVANGSGSLVINPAGTLVALTVTFPASPVDGQVFEIFSTQIVTTMTLNGGTIASALTTIGVNGAARWKYSTSAASWLRAS